MCDEPVGQPTRRKVRDNFLRWGAVIATTAMMVGSCAHREGEQRRARPSLPDATEAHSDHGMVSTGSVEATRAGVRILELGGNAVDAAVAAAFALGVSDPGGSGLGFQETGRGRERYHTSSV